MTRDGNPDSAASRRPPASTPISTDPGRAELVRRANRGDPEAAVRLVRLTEADLAPPTPGFGFVAVRVHKPRPYLFPKVPRRLCEVEQALCELFGRLAAAKAPWPLFLHGQVGSGKTRAALCFADLVDGASYLTLEQACDAVMQGRRPWENTASGKNALLIVDEIGERSTAGDLLYSTLKQIVDGREFHQRRVAVYLSNHPPSGLVELFDDRVVSRLTAGSVYKLTGPDRRREPRRDESCPNNS